MNEKRKSIRIVCNIALIIPLVVALTAATALSTDVTLTWEPNEPPPDGYRVFVRQAGHDYDYDQPHWEGKASTCVLTGLKAQTLYFFVIKAYMGDMESTDSEEVYYAPPKADGDDDGIPDGWEIQFGLDYLTDDSKNDTDADGITNLDEFRAGLDPTFGGSGTPPDAPISFSPGSGDEVEMNPFLEVNDFSDADGDALIATQWQIFDTRTDTCLMDVVTNNYLNALPIPDLLLDGQGTYRWRSRFFDSNGLVSDWSTESYFSTQPAIDDGDGNGIPDDQEKGLFHADISPAPLSPATSIETTSIEISSADTSCMIERITLLDPNEFDVHETTPSDLPSAMVAYKLVCDQPGQWVQVTAHLSGPVPDGTQWIGYDQINGWDTYGEQATFSNDRTAVTIEVRDGGFDDTDGTANGIILNVVGLSEPDTTETPADAAAEEGGSGGGGCFFASTLTIWNK